MAGGCGQKYHAAMILLRCRYGTMVFIPFAFICKHGTEHLTEALTGLLTELLLPLLQAAATQQQHSHAT